MAKKKTARQVAGMTPKRKPPKRPDSFSDLPSWEQSIKELKAFKKEHGHCNVPYKYRANPALARWVVNVRQRKKHGTLPEGEILLLDALGFSWERKTAAAAARAAVWKQRIKELKAFKKEYGHCNVPSIYPPNRPLGSWVDYARSRKKAGELSAERIRCLEELGFCWVLRKRSVYRLDWDVMLAALTAFKERHGHCNVSCNRPEERQLGQWLTDLRRRKRKGKVDQRQISQLNKLGIVWEPNRSSIKPSWSEMYAALVEYKKVHGDCNVPFDWSETPRLGRWIRNQRDARTANRLKQGCVEQLDKLGFVWNLFEDQWESNYSALVDFQREYGHCRVSTLSKTHAALGNWVRTLRGKKRRGRLSADKILRLDALGFTWDMQMPSITATVEVPLTQRDAEVLLTPREAEVLRHVAGRLTNKQIAETLHISFGTVNYHVQNVFRKIGVTDRTQAALWAIRNGLG